MPMSEQVYISPPSCVIDHDINSLVDKDMNWKNRGYHMVGITGYGSSNSKFAAVWNNPNGIEYTFKTNMSPPEFQLIMENMQTEGYIIACLDGYEVSKRINYTAIWEKKNGIDHRVRHGLSSIQFKDACADYGKENYRLVKSSIYNVNEQPCYAGIWVNDGGPETIVDEDMSLTMFEKTNIDNIAKGYRLTDLNACVCKDEPLFVAVWEKGDGSSTKNDTAILDDEFNDIKNEMKKLGFHPLWISGYSFADKEYFAVIWQQWQ